MGKDFEQKISKDDFQALIAESVKQQLEKSKNEKKNCVLDFIKVAITPIVIAVFSMIVTSSINRQQVENTKLINQIQVENTKLITEKQIESANIIAAADREHSRQIAESNQEIERLKHIKEIFQHILESQEERLDNELIKMQIASLEIYKADALLFLLNIKNHYAQMKDCPSCAEFVQEADKSISNILLNSQIDVSDRKFSGEWVAKEGKFQALNLRNKKFQNYNFSRCLFAHMNLYQADFSDCTLKEATFEDVDLYSATFSGSNLSHAVFKKADLRKTDLRNVQLEGVRFVDCRLDGALFSFGSLLKTDTLPFSEVDAATYVKLLQPFRDKIGQMAKSANPDQMQDLDRILEKSQCSDFGALDRLLQQEGEKSKIFSTAEPVKSAS